MASILKSGLPVAICSDHAGFEVKKQIISYLTAQDIAVKDFGIDSEASCDYPDYAHPCAAAVESGKCYPGIAVCGTGEGMAMTLNKHQGIRAALCWDKPIAQLAREHNDANVIVLPGRFITPQKAIELVDTFFHTDFLGGRHQRRINKIPLPQK